VGSSVLTENFLWTRTPAQASQPGCLPVPPPPAKIVIESVWGVARPSGTQKAPQVLLVCHQEWGPRP